MVKSSQAAQGGSKRRPPAAAARRAQAAAAAAPPILNLSADGWLRRCALLTGLGLGVLATGTAPGTAWAAAPRFGTPGWIAQHNQAAVDPGAAAVAKSAAGIGGGVGSVTTPDQAWQRAQRSVADLTRAAEAIANAEAAQSAAQQLALKTPGDVPDGLAAGGLQVADPNTPGFTWSGAGAPSQATQDGRTTVTIAQDAAKAILTWQTFNVGRSTTVDFDQSGGKQTDGSNNWIVLNRVLGTASPSRILGDIKAQGTVYLINQNGILFGSGSSVDTHSLLASSLNLFSNDVATANSDFLNLGLLGFNSNTGGANPPAPVLVDPYGSIRPADTQYTVSGDPAKMPGDIGIEAGASIHTAALGYALIAAPNVSNAGSVVADDGQALLVAAANVVLQPGSSAAGSAQTLLQPYAVGRWTGASNADATPVFKLLNTGTIQAARGQISLIGADVSQDGVVDVSTSLSRQGSIVVAATDEANYSSDTGFAQQRYGNVAFGTGSTTANLPDQDGSTTTSSAVADSQFRKGTIGVAGAAISVDANALIEAPGAALDVQTFAAGVAVTGGGQTIAGRIFLDAGATIDVSGLANVELPLDASLVTIPRVGQNELADSPLQRNGFLYTQKNVTIDSTVGGTRSDGTPWVGGPMLNAAGYVQDVPRQIDQLLVNGGSVTLSGSQVITAAGSLIDLDGGYLHYLPGLDGGTTRLLSTDGHVFDISRADPNLLYAGFAGAFTVTHSRWNVTETYTDPVLSGGLRQHDPGYIQGGNAGTLDIELQAASAQNDFTAVLLDGSLSAHAEAGRRQIADASLPAGGSIDIVNTSPAAQIPTAIVVQDQVPDLAQLAPGFNAATPLTSSGAASDPSNVAYWSPVSGVALADAGFSGVSLTASQILVQGHGLSVQPTTQTLATPGQGSPAAAGAQIDLQAYRVDIEGNLVAPSGHIDVTALGIADVGANNAGPTSGPTFRGADTMAPPATNDIVVGAGVTLSARGRWVNDSGLPLDRQSGAAGLDGGSIALTVQENSGAQLQPGGLLQKPHYGPEQDTTGSIELQAGSVLDVSGGGRVLPDGTLAMLDGRPQGQGGDIALATYVLPASDAGSMPGEGFLPAAKPGVGSIRMDGTLLGYGFAGGGTLSLRALDLQIGGDPAAAASKEALYLPAQFFQGQGFSSYRLSAAWDATIAAGTTVRVTQSDFIPDYATILQAPTGADLYRTDAAHPHGLYASIGQLEPYFRPATDFSLSAGDYLGAFLGEVSPREAGVSGTVLLDQGASIRADAGAAVTLNSFNQLTVLGSITAHGGSITLSGDTDTQIGAAGAVVGYAPYPSATPFAYSSTSKSVWLGAGSVLDVSGTELIDPLAPVVSLGQGRRGQPRSGRLLDGGSVTVSDNTGFVVAQAGSLIDASGFSDPVLELPAASSTSLGAGLVYAPQAAWSDAGSITIGAAGGLYFDGTLQAHAGAAGGKGGSLTITMENSDVGQFHPYSNVPGSAVVHYGVSSDALILRAGGSAVPAGLQPGDYIGGDVVVNGPQNIAVQLPGVLYFSADRLSGSGIDNLSVGLDPKFDVGHYPNAAATIAFAGDLNLKLPGSFTASAMNYEALPAGSTSLAAGASPVGSSVDIAAAYVRIGGDSVNGQLHPDTAPLLNDGVLKVQASAGLDLVGTFALQNFATSTFSSQGDLRLYTPAGQDSNVNGSSGTAQLPGELYTPGNLVLDAAQIYPLSGNTFIIDANAQGLTGADGKPVAATVTFGRPAQPLQQPQPLSAGGTLIVDASHIVQNGVLRAPSGNIFLGTADNGDSAAQAIAAGGLPAVATSSVTLGAGSLTSVAIGSGLTIPYGTTVDGTEWQYNPVQNTNGTYVAPDLGQPPLKQITISAAGTGAGEGAIAIDQGAAIDLAGGGHLQAQEWVPGTGGTRDVLSQVGTNYNSGAAATPTPLFPDGRGVYAIIPGYNSTLGAYDPAFDTQRQAPLVGQSVYLSGIAGLPAGTYTLLPAQYATLPGAYRVVQDTAATTQMSLASQNLVLPDGSYRVGGHFTDTFTGGYGGPAAAATFIVQARPVWEQYSQYTLSSADGFFADQAAHNGTAVPRLPMDAGHLVLAPSQALTFVAPGQSGFGLKDVLADAPASGGAGALVDISAQDIQIVGANAPAAKPGVVQLQAADLDGLDSASLLIGGVRTQTAGGISIAASARDLTLANDRNSALSGSEIILVAAGALTLDAGSVLKTDGGKVPAGTDAATTIAGDGALLMVSDGTAAPTRLDASASPSGSLTIGKGALVSAGQSLTLDAAADVNIDPAAVFSADIINADANTISFVGDRLPPGAAPSGLVIGSQTLAQFGSARQLNLSSRHDIDFFGNVSIDAGAAALTLSAGNFVDQDGGQVAIKAAKLGLANLLDPAAAAGTPAAAPGGTPGSLSLDVGELDFIGTAETVAGSGAGQTATPNTAFFSGFGTVTAGAGSQVLGTNGGNAHCAATVCGGAFDFGNATVRFDTQQMAADTASNIRLQGMQGFTLAAYGGTPAAAPATAGELGGSWNLQADTLTIASSLVARAGQIELSAAKGDLVVADGGKVSVAGAAKAFYDIRQYAPGGTIQLAAANGAVQLRSGAALDFSADPAGGDAGSLSIDAQGLQLDRQPAQLLGSADTAGGYRSGSFSLDLAGALDANAAHQDGQASALDLLAQALGAGGVSQAVSVRTAAGDLVLNGRIAASNVSLRADGGWVTVKGGIDSSGTTAGAAGGAIDLYGSGGVDLEGSLAATAADKAVHGGTVNLGTGGTQDLSVNGGIDPALGYQEVSAASSGSIVLGQQAGIDVRNSADAGMDGSVLIRAPLLDTGDVKVSLSPAQIKAGKVSLEAYAVWSTGDASSGSRHFDGIVDPAGWFDSSGGLVAGKWTDGSGKTVACGSALNCQEQGYFFAPATANAAHTGFYGSTLADFASGRTPGGAAIFDARLSGLFAGNAGFHVVPGIELDNPGSSVDNGDIKLLSNWNLGAATLDQNGQVQSLLYRYQGQAPILTLRAQGNLSLQASISDGFVQLSNPLDVQAPQAASYEQAMALYQTLIGDYPRLQGHIAAPAQSFSAQDQADRVAQYYGLYVQLMDYLLYGNLPSGVAPAAGTTPAAGTLSADTLLPVGAPLAPTQAKDYPAYLIKYAAYLARQGKLAEAPKAPTAAMAGDAVFTGAALATVDNGFAPEPTAANPFPILAASLGGGSSDFASASYRLVAGADFGSGSADPLALQASPGSGGNLGFDGYFSYRDPNANQTVLSPNLVRTGTGFIDIAAANDFSTQGGSNAAAPGAVYTAGRPAPGTTADTNSSLLEPGLKADSAFRDVVVTGVVHPVDAGSLSVLAQGDVLGSEQASSLGGHFWSDWMQTGNAATLSDGVNDPQGLVFGQVRQVTQTSVNFGAFDQDLMSAGGDVSVRAGRNVQDLAVSLPTTWYLTADAAGKPGWTTVGAGNLDLSAGQSIFSGDYFVAKGVGRISAGGQIGWDGLLSVGVGATAGRVSTILALQDGVFDVGARQSIDLGGIFDPSYLPTFARSSDQVFSLDSQPYGSASAANVVSTAGSIAYGSLPFGQEIAFMGAGGAAGSFDQGDILPATVDFTALNGGIGIAKSSELYPAALGGLNLVAQDSISFTNVNGNDAIKLQPGVSGTPQYFGMIDASPATLPSPVNQPNGGTPPPALGYQYVYISSQSDRFLHAPTPLHAQDPQPVRIYSLGGSITDGGTAADGTDYATDNTLIIAPDKPALVYAAGNIANLSFQGQQVHDADLTRIVAGRDIFDNPGLLMQALPTDLALGLPGDWSLVPSLVLAGPGSFDIEAGRNIGPLSNQNEVVTARVDAYVAAGKAAPYFLGAAPTTGIDTVGNAYNPYLPHRGANLTLLFGVAPSFDVATATISDQAFIDRYIDPANAGTAAGVPSFVPDLIAFMEQYAQGQAVDTGFVKDQPPPVSLTAGQAWSAFQALPAYVQQEFVAQVFFDVLGMTGADYNLASSPYFHQYARGYQAVNTLFPASLGYTANNLLGGANGAATTAHTGDLDLRGTTLQTQQGGNIDVFGPGGQAVIGSTSAPPFVLDSTGKTFAGPSTQGILTLEQGSVDMFLDGSLLLAQSRVFTEQGGGMVIWSSNGDINAGKGAKTTTEIPQPDYVCDPDGYCRVDAKGEVSGAGIATLQTVAGAAPGNVYLIAPRGTVDAGDAGIRVSGNLVIAAQAVANADNIQVQGTAVGVPTTKVDTGALNAASASAAAAQEQAAALTNRLPDAAASMITVEVVGFGAPDEEQKKRLLRPGA